MNDLKAAPAAHAKSGWPIPRDRLRELSLHDQNVLRQYSTTPSLESPVWVSLCQATERILERLTQK